MRLAIIGVPYTSSGLRGGEAAAPAALRAAGLIDALRASNDVIDYGDVPILEPSQTRDPVSGVIAPHVMAAMIDAVRGEVDRALRESRLPIVVGGECPLLLGCLAAARKYNGRVGLLFIDGHEDAWDPHLSTTGEAADMELGLALGLTRAPNVDDLAAILPLVQPEDVVVLGPRDRADLDAEEAPSIASNVTFLDDVALLNGDVGATTGAFANRLHRDAGHWWFHVDLDALSTEAMPAVRYPQPGGLAWQHLEAVTEAALRTPGLIGWDITIYNPDLDPDRRSANRIVAFLGEMARHLR